MLRRDYLLKLIQDLFSAITRVLIRDGGEIEKRRDVEALYTEFGANADFFRSASRADLIDQVANWVANGTGVSPSEIPKDEMEQRLELLALLLYADFKVSELQFGLQCDVARRSLALFLMVDASSDSYSIDRRDKIIELRSFLGDGNDIL